MTIRYNEGIVQFSVTQNVNKLVSARARCRVLKIVTFVFIRLKPKCEGKMAHSYLNLSAHSLCINICHRMSSDIKMDIG